MTSRRKAGTLPLCQQERVAREEPGEVALCSFRVLVFWGMQVVRMGSEWGSLGVRSGFEWGSLGVRMGFEPRFKPKVECLVSVSCEEGWG